MEVVESPRIKEPEKSPKGVITQKFYLESKTITNLGVRVQLLMERESMRIAFVSDIHGNFIAFQAVLKDLESQKVDQVISLGDTVTIGPQPLEVLEKLMALNCICIKGNHDAAVLTPEQAVHYQITEHLIPDLHWCKNKLTQEQSEFIESFRLSYEFTFPNGISVLCFHGSPLSLTDLIQATTPPKVLDTYFKGQTSNVFIGGHSHIQMYRRHGDKVILNSGSVGNAFEFAFSSGVSPVLLPWAEYIILSQNGSSLDVDLRRVYFDTDKLIEVVKESGLPGAKWWLDQYKNKR